MAKQELLRGAGDVHTDAQGNWQPSAPPPPSEHEVCHTGRFFPRHSSPRASLMSGPVAQAVAAAEDAYAFAQDALRRLPADVTIEVCVCVCVCVFM